MNILFTWIGSADLRASKSMKGTGLGPVLAALNEFKFDKIHFLSNFTGNDKDFSEKDVQRYIKWVEEKHKINYSLHQVSMKNPTDFAVIYPKVKNILGKVQAKHKAESKFHFHLSPGTPSMAAVWIILGKTKFPATLLQSTKEKGAKVARVPFDLSAEFIPDILGGPDKRLMDSSGGIQPEHAEFKDIKHRSPEMKRIVQMARKAALHGHPILIEGESGTGKELFAKAIHNTSPRKEKPFKPVNCGAIPVNLVESELFGHKKGSFTGADKDKKGHFEMANGGTIFLDEIGELPLNVQVTLLRVLQEMEITPLGSSKSVKINVRVVAATHRNLIEEINKGNFREDLFYRLAVAVLNLPALRDRSGDIGLLSEHLMDEINREGANVPDYQDKKLSTSAKNFIIQQEWPGNIRELHNTILRAALWNNSPVITKDDIRQNLIQPVYDTSSRNIMERPFGRGFSIEKIREEVTAPYIKRALKSTSNNKSKSAKLLGLKSYQTLSNWMQKYNI